MTRIDWDRARIRETVGPARRELHDDEKRPKGHGPVPVTAAAASYYRQRQARLRAAFLRAEKARPSRDQ